MEKLSSEFFEGRLWVFYRNVFCTIDNMLSPEIINAGLSLTQARILFCVCETRDISVGDLSGQINMNTGNCSTTCKKLEQQGFLTRYRSKEDERIVLLLPTEQGMNIYKEILLNASKLHHDILAKISKAEREEIINNLEKIESFFKKLKNNVCSVKEMKENGNK